MKIIIRAGLLIIFLALGFWLWTIFFPSPEKIIRKQLNELARSASFLPNEAPAARMFNAAKLAGYFSPDARLSFDGVNNDKRTLEGQDEIVKGAMAARALMPSIDVQFIDINIMVGLEKTSAIVELTAKVKLSTENDFLVQELKFIMKKIDGKWLIVRGETVKVLS